MALDLASLKTGFDLSPWSSFICIIKSSTCGITINLSVRDKAPDNKTTCIFIALITYKNNSMINIQAAYNTFNMHISHKPVKLSLSFLLPINLLP